MKLTLLEIERFALHDGPGIRSVAFFKGCPFHCPWCANPESQRGAPERMFDAGKCVGCGLCEAACGRGAVRMCEGRPAFDPAKCAACGACARACLGGALCVAGESWDAEDALALLARDRTYYRLSGGGVTLSGGEPFAQPEGALWLLSRLRALGVHTAVETTACVPADVLRAAEPDTDLFLVDWKHADADTLRRVTGIDLARVTDGLRALPREKVRLRTPVVPGFNASRAEIARLDALAASLGLARPELLPYHTLGRGKYARLGRPYPLDGVPALPQGALDALRGPERPA